MTLLKPKPPTAAQVGGEGRARRSSRSTPRARRTTGCPPKPPDRAPRPRTRRRDDDHDDAPAPTRRADRPGRLARLDHDQPRRRPLPEGRARAPGPGRRRSRRGRRRPRTGKRGAQTRPSTRFGPDTRRDSDRPSRARSCSTQIGDAVCRKTEGKVAHGLLHRLRDAVATASPSATRDRPQLGPSGPIEGPWQRPLRVGAGVSRTSFRSTSGARTSSAAITCARSRSCTRRSRASSRPCSRRRCARARTARSERSSSSRTTSTCARCPNPSYLIVLSLNPLPGAAILQFPLPIVFAAIDRLLGGTGDSVSPKRPLTEIESNLMRSVVDRTLRELEYAYETLVRVEAEIVQQEFNPQFAQIAAPSDMAMVVSFDTRIGEKHGNATICVPFSTMQPVLESLASQSLLQDHRGQDPDALAAASSKRALYTRDGRDLRALRRRRAHVERDRRLAGRRHRSARPSHRTTRDVSVDDVTCNKAVTGRRGKRLACLVVDANQEQTDDAHRRSSPPTTSRPSVARALEQVLGDDVILAVGAPEPATPTDDLLPEGATRSVALPFTDGVDGEIALIVGEQLATAMEAATADELLVERRGPGARSRRAARSSRSSTPSVNVDGAGEVATETLLTSDDGDFVVVPLLENDERVACVVVRIVEDDRRVAPPTAPHRRPARSPPRPASRPSSRRGPVRRRVALHEFEPLDDGWRRPDRPRPLAILKDVEMGVTAELGRRRMTVRDLLALTPGSVIELDRAAGSPGRRARERHADRARRSRRDRRGVRHPHRGDRRRGAMGEPDVDGVDARAVRAPDRLARRRHRPDVVRGARACASAASAASATPAGRGVQVDIDRPRKRSGGTRRSRSCAPASGRWSSASPITRSRSWPTPISTRSISRTRRANGRLLRKGRTARLRHGRRCSTSCGTAPSVAERHRARKGFRAEASHKIAAASRRRVVAAVARRALRRRRRCPIVRARVRVARAALADRPRPRAVPPAAPTVHDARDHRADDPEPATVATPTTVRQRRVDLDRPRRPRRQRRQEEAQPERRHHPAAHGARDRAGADGDAHELHAHRDRAVAHPQRARAHLDPAEPGRDRARRCSSACS